MDKFLQTFLQTLTNEQVELLKELGSIKLFFNYLSSKVQITVLKNKTKDVDYFYNILSNLQNEYNELSNNGVKLKDEKFEYLSENEKKMRRIYQKIYSIKSNNSLLEKK